MTRAATKLIRTNETVTAVLDLCDISRHAPFSLLIIGTDHRHGIWREPSPVSNGPPEPGRADAIVLVVSNPVTGIVDALTVPRSIGVDVPPVGYQRLGWALGYGGASALVASTKQLLDIPIHHYVSVDFQGFAAVVDAIGGVTLNLEQAVRDRRTGLDLPRGEQHVRGDQALAFVRSRYKESGCGGHPPRISLGDEGRRERLRCVAEAFAARLETGLGPVAHARLALAAGRHLVVDASLAHRLRTDTDLPSVLTGNRASRLRLAELPTRPARPHDALRSPFPPHQVCGAAYLELDPDRAESVLEPLRATVVHPARSTTGR